MNNQFQAWLTALALWLSSSINQATNGPEGIFLGIKANPSPDCGGQAYSCFLTALQTFETSIGRTMAMYNSYYAWSSYASFPSVVEINNITAPRYSVVAVNCGDTDYNVANGVDDATIINWATQIKQFNAPVMFRWFWEMNLDDSSDGTFGSRTLCYDPNHDGVNSPENTNNPGTVPVNYFSPQWYRAAWQHIHTVFQQQGVTNVSWYWGPSGGGIGNGAPVNLYYPGDSYVDWTGFDVYDRKDTTPNSNSLLQTFLPVYTVIQQATNSPKPMLVAETGSYAGNQAAYLSNMQTTLSVYMPQIRAVEYFDVYSMSNDWSFGSAGLTAFTTLAATSYMSAPGPQTMNYPFSQLPSPSPVPTPGPYIVTVATPAAIPTPLPNLLTYQPEFNCAATGKPAMQLDYSTVSVLNPVAIALLNNPCTIERIGVNGTVQNSGNELLPLAQHQMKYNRIDYLERDLGLQPGGWTNGVPSASPTPYGTPVPGSSAYLQPHSMIWIDLESAYAPGCLNATQCSQCPPVNNTNCNGGINPDGSQLTASATDYENMTYNNSYWACRGEQDAHNAGIYVEQMPGFDLTPLSDATKYYGFFQSPYWTPTVQCSDVFQIQGQHSQQLEPGTPPYTNPLLAYFITFNEIAMLSIHAIYPNEPIINGMGVEIGASGTYPCADMGLPQAELARDSGYRLGAVMSDVNYSPASACPTPLPDFNQILNDQNTFFQYDVTAPVPTPIPALTPEP